MKTIVVLGAGLSSSSLIRYLLEHAAEEDWKVVLGDISEELASRKIDNHPRGRAVKFDIEDRKQREDLLQQSDVVISLLPPLCHTMVAKG